MLTRLRVDGFKNLVGVDVRFGAFSCIAGANGAGKSNLFDAIRFLSALADKPLIDACLSVRDESRRGRAGDLRSIFNRVGEEYSSRMSFEVEMIVPPEGEDDLGQRAKAAITFLTYRLTLAFKQDHQDSDFGGIEIVEETLTHITLGNAPKRLLFPHSASWRKTAITGRRSGTDFISTVDENGIVIRLHQDGGGSRGRPLSRKADRLPRTVLSAANASESQTVLLARREMQSWRLLQLEPSSLREPDDFSSPIHVGSDGSHLPATLARLARQNGGTDLKNLNPVYSRVANRLADLINDVRYLYVDQDEKRELLTLLVAGKDGTHHKARALSDGTLRFLALAVIANDPEEAGVICLEEPENGIHPERIPAIIDLLEDISCDLDEPIGKDNPLRQVIINTHSPAVVAEVPDNSLVVAEPHRVRRGDQFVNTVRFSALSDTWRTTKSFDGEQAQTSKGRLLAYLNPTAYPSERSQPVARRVIDREDMQRLLPFER